MNMVVARNSTISQTRVRLPGIPKGNSFAAHIFLMVFGASEEVVRGKRQAPKAGTPLQEVPSTGASQAVRRGV